jgi:anti-anti-sigma factor
VELLTMSTRAHGPFTVITLAGELDLSTAPRLQQELIRTRTTSPRLVLDMAGLTFMDTTGLRVIVKAHAHAQESGGTVTLAGVSGAPLQVLQITGLHKRLPVLETLDEALSTAPQ